MEEHAWTRHSHQASTDEFRIRRRTADTRRYTCDGADQTPPLSWGEPPEGTKSFALVIDDPDAPSGTFRHWGVYDIPASTRSIGGGEPTGTEVSNDFGKRGYGGPCPPKGHGPHHYHFKLFALNVERLDLAPGSGIADVENEAASHAIAQGELVGTYESPLSSPRQPL